MRGRGAPSPAIPSRAYSYCHSERSAVARSRRIPQAGGHGEWVAQFTLSMGRVAGFFAALRMTCGGLRMTWGAGGTALPLPCAVRPRSRVLCGPAPMCCARPLPCAVRPRSRVLCGPAPMCCARPLPCAVRPRPHVLCVPRSRALCFPCLPCWRAFFVDRVALTGYNQRDYECECTDTTRWDAVSCIRFGCRRWSTSFCG